MARSSSNPIGIYHRTGTIVYYGARRNGKDRPGTAWVSVTAPAQRAMLDAGVANGFRDLTYTRGGVRQRTAADRVTRRQAELDVLDVGWIRAERQAALVEVLVDELNKLGANPPLDSAGVESAYLAKLATSRGS